LRHCNEQVSNLGSFSMFWNTLNHFQIIINYNYSNFLEDPVHTYIFFAQRSLCLASILNLWRSLSSIFQDGMHIQWNSDFKVQCGHTLCKDAFLTTSRNARKVFSYE
jgi:hypothetical protein